MKNDTVNTIQLVKLECGYHFGRHAGPCWKCAVGLTTLVPPVVCEIREPLYTVGGVGEPIPLSEAVAKAERIRKNSGIVMCIERS